MYAFARRPLWVVSHVLVVALIVVLVSLGFWQLRRHDERADRNDDIVARSEAAPVELGVLVEEVVGGAEPTELRYRPVTATGTYGDAAVLVDNRSRDGLPGAWVLGVLDVDGTAVAVSRGFLAPDGGTYDVPPAPEGEVDLTGTVVEWDGDCGVRTDDAGAVAGMACLNRDAFETAVGGPVAPVVVQRVSSAPADAAGLSPVPRPELDAGPHRSYAAQWFIFAIIGIVGYPLVLRRVARDANRTKPTNG